MRRALCAGARRAGASSWRRTSSAPASCWTSTDETVVDIWGGWCDTERQPAVGAGHDHQRVVDHQDGDQPRRAHAHRPRRGRCLRPGGRLLARVRRQRQGGDRGPPHPQPHLRSLGLGRAVRGRGHVRLDVVDRAAGRPGAVVGARHRVRLPRQQPGPPGRRDRAPRHRHSRSSASWPSRSPGRSAPTSRSAPPSATGRGSPRSSSRRPLPIDLASLPPESPMYKTFTGPVADAANANTAGVAPG